jgi:hypothetical protein
VAWYYSFLLQQDQSATDACLHRIPQKDTVAAALLATYLQLPTTLIVPHDSSAVEQKKQWLRSLKKLQKPDFSLSLFSLVTPVANGY